MKQVMIVFFVLFSFSTWASLEKAPPTINMTENRGKAVFVDFTKADYQIVYDIPSGRAWADSTIIFQTRETGHAIFDLIPAAASASIDNVAVTILEYTISGVTKIRYSDTVIAPGLHTLKIRNQINENVAFSGRQVRSAFWSDDLSDRGFLEQYLPSNFEFDQYKMKFAVKILGSDLVHEIFTNGDDKLVATNDWLVEFPEYFNTSSIFFHIMPAGSFRKQTFNFRSMDGREIPGVVYGLNISGYEDKTLSTLTELEQDYGPFPHQKVVIYAAGGGGMEYCGATMTSLWALSHELTHSYFARGVMPAAGNAGWIDEAIASWRDDGYPQHDLSRLSPSQMAGHSAYMRATDRNAYTKGAQFMGYMDKLFAAKGGLKKFLRDLVDRKLFQPLLTPEFQQDVELFFNQSLDVEFKKYIYGAQGLELKGPMNQDLHNPYHPRLSKEELRKLL